MLKDSTVQCSGGIQMGAVHCVKHGGVALPGGMEQSGKLLNDILLVSDGNIGSDLVCAIGVLVRSVAIPSML